MSTVPATRSATRLSQRLLRPSSEHPLVALWSQLEWQVETDAPTVADALRGGLGQLVGSSGDISTIKTGPHRTVYRVRTSRGEFFVKHFHPVGGWNWLKHFVRSTRAEHERDLAHWLTARGVPTITPLAVGLRRHLGSPCESLLVMPAIPGVPLDDHCRQQVRELTERERAVWRQELARALGQFLGQLHREGGDHRDLHAGNVLVETTARGPRLHLIDLQALRRRSTLSLACRLANLARFHQFFVGLSTRSDRRRFWLAYLAATPTEPVVPPQFSLSDWFALTCGWPIGPPATGTNGREVARRLEDLLVGQARAGWDRADRAWRRGNRHVRRLRVGRHRLRGEATLPADWLRSVAEAPEQLFAPDSLVQLCKNSARCRVALVRLPLDGPERALCVKSVVAGRWVSRWLDGWRFSLVRRAWETGHALLRRGLDTPRPLLCVEVPQRGGTRGYLVTEWLENTETAQAAATTRLREQAPRARTAWLASRGRQLASLLRRFHACGFDHRDLKLANLLVSRQPNDPRVWLLDLDGVRRWKRLPRQRAVQNLARLEVSCRVQGVTSATLRLRFLREYLAGSGEDWRSWWKWVAKAGRRKVSQNARRGRPIS
jgi:tRNA A-37 threonylcarbamoyl transferase component Bud32